MPAPCARQRRGPRARGQADRARESALPRVRPQRRLARALPDRPRPHGLDATARAHRRARRLRTQDAALPTAAHRRPLELSRPPRHPTTRARLALGRGPDRRLHASGRTLATRALTPSARRPRPAPPRRPPADPPAASARPRQLTLRPKHRLLPTTRTTSSRSLPL